MTVNGKKITRLVKLLVPKDGYQWWLICEIANSSENSKKAQKVQSIVNAHSIDHI